MVYKQEENDMEFKFSKEDKFYEEFIDLIAFIECGEHYNSKQEQHVNWLKRRIHSIYLMGGMALCVYDNGKPAGFLLYQHDLGLENVCCFGKVARIIMLGFHKQYQGKGLGTELVDKVCQKVKADGADCIYTDTYVLNKGAIKFYVNDDFVPVAVHECENGTDDMGQLYLYRKLK